MFTSLWTLLFRMRLSGLVFSMLVFVTVVYSAAIKGQNEDFLNFLNEAFSRNSSESVVTVSGSSNPVGVPDPITVCPTSNPMENPTELLGVFPETDSVEYSDTTDEKSKENSKSADQTDSESAERTIMDKYVKSQTEKQSSITEEDRSQQSQEMHGSWDSVTDQKRKRRKDTERGRDEQGVTPITETKANKMDSYVPDQLRAKERNRKGKALKTRKSNSSPLSDSQNIIDQSQECVEMSSWMTGYPDGENTSVDGAGVDLQSEEGGAKYERQPRKLCGARKGLRTPRPQRERLDTDSAETVNSELQDRDNSSESIPVQNLQ